MLSGWHEPWFYSESIGKQWVMLWLRRVRSRGSQGTPNPRSPATGDPGPQPHPLPACAWGSGRPMARFWEQLAPCPLRAPEGRVSRGMGSLFPSPPNKAALSGGSQGPSAPPGPLQPPGLSSERQLYLGPRPDCWEGAAEAGIRAQQPQP